MLKRLPIHHKGLWGVGGSNPPDKINLLTSVPIKLVGISLHGASKQQSLSGKITVSQESREIASVLFNYDARPEVPFTDKSFDAPVALSAGVQYTITLEYFGEEKWIYYSDDGRKSLSLIYLHHSLSVQKTLNFSYV